MGEMGIVKLVLRHPARGTYSLMKPTEPGRALVVSSRVCVQARDPSVTGEALARSGWGLSVSCGSRTLDGVGDHFLGPDLGSQVEALIMAFHQHREAAGGTNSARLALKAKADG